jgi:UDP-N-acetylmuramoyl-tripeptide--D-alanyl-D-alanine ligase
MNIDELYSIYLNHPSVQTDTRMLKKNDIFFALKGPHFNGNTFAQQAIASGAAFAVIDEPEYEIPDKTLLVKNVLQTLQQLAHHHRKQFQIPFLAITGSNGKTTTKELIHEVLKSSYKVYTTEGNLNNHIGVPLTILKIKRDAEIAVIEMGANHLHEIEQYCSIAEPTHGLITNCGKAHLEGFGSIEGVKKGKGELFDHLRKNRGTAYIMQDYDYLKEMSKDIPNIFTYGTKNANVVGNVVSSSLFLTVKIEPDTTIHTKLAGDYNLPNVLAAAAVGQSMKIEMSKIKTAIENYIPSNSRSQLIEKGSNKILLDAYNANPSSMKLAIENFAKINAKNKVLMLGAMAEMGDASAAEHEALINHIKQYQWNDVILVGKAFEPYKNIFHYFDNAVAAGKWFTSQLFENSYFLIKGSRSSQMEKAIGQFNN